MSQAESLQKVALIVSPHAFLFGLAELRIARHMERHPKERRALIVCGWCEIALGIGLVRGYMLPTNRVVELLAGAAILTISTTSSPLFYGDNSTRSEFEAR